MNGLMARGEGCLGFPGVGTCSLGDMVARREIRVRTPPSGRWSWKCDESYAVVCSRLPGGFGCNRSRCCLLRFDALRAPGRGRLGRSRVVPDAPLPVILALSQTRNPVIAAVGDEVGYGKGARP